MKKKILVVDDERLIADSMAMFLNRTGEFDVVASYDLHGALFEGRKIKPDMVLLDVLRPRSNGVLDACRIRKELNCPVLLMSGAAFKTGEIQCPPEGTGGPFQILSKPILPMVLLEQIKKFVETGSIEMSTSQA
ncbi:MAG: response regulator [Acidobacteria bacterium]|nr:response regulator [Acidobacteriota bacterium]